MPVYPTLKRAAHRLHRLANPFQRAAKPSAPLAGEALLVALLRPKVGNATPAMRQVLQPLVFVCSTLALLVLAALGLVSASLLLLAGAFIVAILQHIFGIELGLNTPPQAA